jgi:hypothetical protein
MDDKTLALYAPGNAKNLTAENLTAMQGFDLEDLKALAMAHPNKAQSSAYLILYDKTKKPKEQLYSLSTWKNLYELNKMGNKNFYAVSFRSIFNRKDAAKLVVAPMQDLTKEEALKAPGLKKAGKAVKATSETKTASTPALPKAEEQVVESKVLSLEKMNKEELATEFEKTTGKAPGSRASKKEMIDAINKANKGKK